MNVFHFASSTSEPEPLSRVEGPGKIAMFVDTWEGESMRNELFGSPKNCCSNQGFTEDNDDFCILLSPRTVCRKVTGEFEIKKGKEQYSN